MEVKSKKAAQSEGQSEEPFTIVVTAYTSVIQAITGDNNNRELLMGQIKIHAVLKELMEREQISARQLSKNTKIPASTLSTYITGKKSSYQPEHLVTIASYFSVSIDYLLLGETDSSEVLNSLKTEEFFSGWLKVKIERAILSKTKKN